MIDKELDIESVSRAASAYFHESFTLARAPQGRSTYVYAVHTDEKTYYMRILPEDTSFAIEVRVHKMLWDIGVSVPHVLYYENKNKWIGLSLMIEEEMIGSSIENETPTEKLERILHDAGRQIALANQIPVKGFGFLDRSFPDTLKGEYATFTEFYLASMDRNIKALTQYPFAAPEIRRIDRLLNDGYERMRDSPSRLVHGDFDVAHIFHHNGRFSGIIDWGEIRGCPMLYDLATFRLCDRTQDGIGYKAIIGGYGTIHPLSVDDLTNVELLALFQGVRLLGKKTGIEWYKDHFYPVVKRHLTRMSSTAHWSCNPS